MIEAGVTDGSGKNIGETIVQMNRVQKEQNHQLTRNANLLSDDDEKDRQVGASITSTHVEIALQTQSTKANQADLVN